MQTLSPAGTARNARARRADWGNIQEISRGVWRIRYWAQGADGYKRRSKTVRGTRKDAGNMLAKLRLQHSDDAPCPTVGECWDRWLLPLYREREVTGDVSPRTVAQAIHTFEKWVRPTWGKVPADSVRPLAVQEWLQTMTANVAPAALRLARRCVEFAVRYEVTPTNAFAISYVMPAASTAGKRESGVWTPHELGALYRAMRELMPWAMPAYLLAAMAGCRPGESLGVRSSEVTLDVYDGVPVASMPIERQLTDHGMADRLKTQSSRRVVVVPGRQGLLIASMAHNGNEWLCSDGAGGYVSRHQLKDNWGSICAHAGVQQRPFPRLRATWRTIGEDVLEMPPSLLEKMMGHTGKDITARHYYTPDGETFARAIAQAYAKHPYAEDW